MSLHSFYLTIFSKNRLGPYQIYAKLMIVFHWFQCPPEASYPVATKGKKKAHFYLHVSSCARAFLLYFGGVGLCVNESWLVSVAHTRFLLTCFQTLLIITSLLVWRETWQLSKLWEESNLLETLTFVSYC